MIMLKIQNNTLQDGEKLDNLPANTNNVLATKQDKETGKGLSTNDFSNTDKAKLDGIDMSLKLDKALTNLSGIDLNTITDNGFYCANTTCTNLPETGVKTRLRVNKDPSNPNLSMQEALTTTTLVSYVRTTANGGTSWTSWTRIKAIDETKEPLKGADDNYVTDAQLVVIANTSGTNTGNETTTTIANLYKGATTHGTLDDLNLFGVVADIVGATLNKITWGTIKTALKTYFDTLYAKLNGDITQSFGASIIELGNSSDTTISRVSAGVVAVEGVPVPTISSTNTITGKRNQPRIVSAISYTTNTGTSLDFSTCDEFIITAQAGALLFNNPSGTPQHGEKIIIRIKDNGTARALTYGTQFRAIGVTLPTTTVISKTLYIGGIWNATDTKLDVVAVAQEI